MECNKEKSTFIIHNNEIFFFSFSFWFVHKWTQSIIPNLIFVYIKRRIEKERREEKYNRKLSFWIEKTK